MKGTFFTKRHRELMGLAEPEEPSAPPANVPPRCCDKAKGYRCHCDAPGWECPEHGTRTAPCNPRFTHD